MARDENLIPDDDVLELAAKAALNDPDAANRLFCSVCNVDIGERRVGKSGRQQTMCEHCKEEKKKAHQQAWNSFQYGEPLKMRRRKSC